MGGHAVEVDGIRIQPRLGMETQLCKTIAAGTLCGDLPVRSLSSPLSASKVRYRAGHE